MSDEQSCMIQKIDSERLKIFAMLEKYPIYEYMSEKNADILCMGRFDVLYGYIRDIAAIGQMLDVRLRFHIVPSELGFKKKLMEKAPLLERYSNLGAEPIETYAEFFFYRRQDEVETACRYVLVAYKGAQKQKEALGAVIEAARDIKEKVCIHYMGEKRDENGLPGNVVLNRPDSFNPRESFVASLGERAFRLHYLYSRDGNPGCSYARCRDEFLKDQYNQTSSAASALHCKYKLYSIGINPRGRKESVLNAYEEKVFGADRQTWNALIYLEHRRWMMYTIFAGYRLPEMEEINRYAFVDGHYRWRSDKDRLHNCLVPSSRTDGLKLQEYPKQKWGEVPEEGMFDPLDQMSLAIHRLAGEKMATARIAVDGELRTIRVLLESCGELSGETKEVYEAFCMRLDNLFRGRNLSLADACFEGIERCMADHALPRNNLQNIRIHLKIVFEYYSFRDFKTSDCVMVDDLPYMMYAPFNVALIKPMSEKMIDNIAAPLLMEPQSVTYIMQQPQPIDEYRAFFGGRGRGTTVEAEVLRGGSVDSVKKELKKIIDRYGKRPCVVDITGANALLAGAVMQLAQNSGRLGVVCTDAAKQKVINIFGFAEASLYRQRQAISTQEAYGLFGARYNERLSGDRDAVLELHGVIPRAWKFFCSMGRVEYTALCQFFSHYLPRSGISFLKVTDAAAEMVSFKEKRSEEFFNGVGLQGVFGELERRRVIRELKFTKETQGMLRIDFSVAKENENAVKRLFNELKKEQYEVFSFYSEGEKQNYVGVRARVSSVFRIKAENVFRSYGNAYSVRSVVMRWLNKMNEYGLISRPTMNEDELNFRFNGISSNAAETVFSKSGSILELYAWWAAASGKICDEVCPSFGFTWNESGEIENELDLILGKGMETAVVSCKSKKYERSEVYEVLYLAKRFSLNSRAAIIYHPDEKGLRDFTPVERKRVQEMGVDMIVIQDLEEQARQMAEEQARQMAEASQETDEAPQEAVDADELLRRLLTERLQSLLG